MKILALLLLPAFAVAGYAHELEITVEVASPAVIVHATYGGTEPMARAEVVIYEPGELEVEFQNGSTDAKGVFSFVPNREGDWRFVIDDGLGHRQESTVSVHAGQIVAQGGTGPSTPLPIKLVMGLSVILAVSGFLYGYTARRSRGRSTPL